jgi:hypothetical protein
VLCLINEKVNAFKELSKILLELSPKEIATAIENRDLIEVQS